MTEIMTNEERITRAQALFLGTLYFHSFGEFDKDEFLNQMDREFKILKFSPYKNGILGASSINRSIITLYADKGHILGSAEFSENIGYYRSTILHEMIHKFLTQKNENGQEISSGLHKLIYNNVEFQKYLDTSIVYKILIRIEPLIAKKYKIKISKYDFGIGANEGYTEWFRENILKNDENISYLKLVNIFRKIQSSLEDKNQNTMEIMRKFKDGDYEYFFHTLNMPKEIGILFVRILDYICAEEEENEKIQKYISNKTKQKELERQEYVVGLNANEKAILEDINAFCLNVENSYEEIKNQNLSEEQIQNELKKLAEFYEKNASSLAGLLNTQLSKFYNQQNVSISNNSDDFLEKTLQMDDSIISLFYELFDYLHVKEFKKENISKDIYGEIKQTLEDIENTFFEANGSKALNISTCKNINDIIDMDNNDMGQSMIINKPKHLQTLSKNNMKKWFNPITKYMVWHSDLKFKSSNQKMKISDLIRIKSLQQKISTKEFEDEDNNKSAKKASLLILLLIGCLTALTPKSKSTEEDSSYDTKITVETSIDDENGTPEKENHNDLSEKIELPKFLKIPPSNRRVTNIDNEFVDNGFTLLKGQAVYRNCYGDNIVHMNYDYYNLYCDSVRVILDNQIVTQGYVEDINTLYQYATVIGANVRLRLGIVNNDNSITYIAWVDIEDILDNFNEKEPYVLRYKEKH